MLQLQDIDSGRLHFLHSTVKINYVACVVLYRHLVSGSVAESEVSLTGEGGNNQYPRAPLRKHEGVSARQDCNITTTTCHLMEIIAFQTR